MGCVHFLFAGAGTRPNVFMGYKYTDAVFKAKLDGLTRKASRLRCGSVNGQGSDSWHRLQPARHPGVNGRSDRSNNILPYRPLPFLAGIDAQIGPKQVLAATRKLLMRANFPITLGKLGRLKINSPSRHQRFRSNSLCRCLKSPACQPGQPMP